MQQVLIDTGSSVDEEQPASPQRIEVIRSQQPLSPDDEGDGVSPSADLRSLLKRKAVAIDKLDEGDLRLKINSNQTRRSLVTYQEAETPSSPDEPVIDLRDKLNANSDDLHVRLNRSKPTDLRRRLELSTSARNPEPSKPDDKNIPIDLRSFLDVKRTIARPQLNVIMGGSPPCGDSVRSVKDYI